MIHLQNLWDMPKSPEKIPRVPIFKIRSVKSENINKLWDHMQKAKLVPILVAILQQVLHSYWRNTLNLQLAGSTASWCPGKHGLNKSIRRFSIKLTLWVGDILESQVHFLLERKVGEKLDLLCIGPACVPVLRICWWTLCVCVSLFLTMKSLTVCPQLHSSSTATMLRSDMSGLLNRWSILSLTDVAPAWKIYFIH